MSRRTRAFRLSVAALSILALLPGVRLDGAAFGLAEGWLPTAALPPAHPVPLPSATAGAPTQAQVEAALQSAPVMFVQSVGQFAAGARFRVYGGGLDLWLADDGLWVTVWEPAPAPEVGQLRAPREEEALREGQPRRDVALHLSFAGADPHPHIEPFAPVGIRVSYFVGDDPSRWRSGVPVWGGVRYVDLYPGIDLVVGANLAPPPGDTTGAGPAPAGGSSLRWRVVVREGGDPSAVRLRVEGAEVVERLLPAGGGAGGEVLTLHTAVGDVALPLLGIEGAVPGAVPAVSGLGGGSFEVASPFSLASSLPLSASPQDNPDDLLHATFLGERHDDWGRAIALDGAGNVYVAGGTRSADFPTTAGAYDPSYNGFGDVFLAVLDPTLSHLSYATFLGGAMRTLALPSLWTGRATSTWRGGPTPPTFPPPLGRTIRASMEDAKTSSWPC